MASKLSSGDLISERYASALYDLAAEKKLVDSVLKDLEFLQKCMKENKDLMAFVNDHRIALEICLKSNIQTRSITFLNNHPFKYYFDQHLRVTLNTDNRLISNTTLSEEYYLAVETFNLTLQNIRTIIINGFKSAFLPHNERRDLIKTVVDELESEFSFEKRVIV